MDQRVAALKATGDCVSGCIILGAWLQWLPHVAAALSIVWTLIRIYETRTVQALIYRLRTMVARGD